MATIATFTAKRDPRHGGRSFVGLARPEGFGRTPPTIVIEGVDELVEALLAA
jgi:hypothetical protein